MIEITHFPMNIFLACERISFFFQIENSSKLLQIIFLRVSFW